MLALDGCQDARHLSSLAMHMNDITFSQRSFGKPRNKSNFLSPSQRVSLSGGAFPASHFPLTEHGGDTKPSASKRHNLASMSPNLSLPHCIQSFYFPVDQKKLKANV